MHLVISHYVVACSLLAVIAAEVPLGYQTLRKEVMDVDTVVKGKIPKWLQGYSVRQMCGSLGDLESRTPGHYIDSFFDCIPAISQFKLYGKDGSTFGNRYPDTIVTKVWKEYNMNMTASGIYFTTAFSIFNPLRVAQYPGIRRFPAATFWQIGEDIVAKGENVDADLVDLDTLKTERYPWGDDNLGYPHKVTFFLHNPAHDHIDGDFTWSTTSVAQLNPVTKTLVIKQAVYKIRNGTRRVFSEYTYGTVDLKTCRGGPYMDLEVRPGYMHAFLMTKNYLILPVTSYLIDPCALFVYRKPLPLFGSAYHFYSNSTSKLIIMRKSDGKFVKVIKTKPFFATHMLNAYEKGKNIYADFLTFPDASIYTKFTFMDSLMNEKEWSSVVERFVIRKGKWTLKTRRRLTEYAMLEFSNINYDRVNGKNYKYAYISRRPSFTNGAIMKLDVRNGKVKEYKAPEGTILQEANFVQRPGSRQEDGGVLLVHGLDTRTKKAYLSILNARKMKEIARIVAPQHALFGIHSRFFPFLK